MEIRTEYHLAYFLYFFIIMFLGVLVVFMNAMSELANKWRVLALRGLARLLLSVHVAWKTKEMGINTYACIYIISFLQSCSEENGSLTALVCILVNCQSLVKRIICAYNRTANRRLSDRRTIFSVMLRKDAANVIVRIQVRWVGCLYGF